MSADSDGVLGIWDVEHDYKLQMFTEKTDWIWSIAFSPDGTLLASGSFDGTILLWDMKPYISTIDAC